MWKREHTKKRNDQIDGKSVKSKQVREIERINGSQEAVKSELNK